MSTELQLSDQMRKVELLATSSLLPEAYRRKPENLLWAAELAGALDITLAQAVQSISIISGKPTMSAELMRALILRAGHRFKVSEMSEKKATVVVARREFPEDVQEFTFTMADAQRAGLTNGVNWKKYPQSMLLARVTSMAGRAVFPDVLSGVGYVPEELGHAESPRPTVDTTRLHPKPTVERVETEPEADEMEVVDVETGEIFDAEVLETEPEAAETEPESGPPPLTSEQSSRIVAALKALKLNKVDALALYSEVCGRAVPATWELTRVEAGLVLAQLETMTDGDG